MRLLSAALTQPSMQRAAKHLSGSRAACGGEEDARIFFVDPKCSAPGDNLRTGESRRADRPVARRPHVVITPWAGASAMRERAGVIRRKKYAAILWWSGCR